MGAGAHGKHRRCRTYHEEVVNRFSVLDELGNWPESLANFSVDGFWLTRREKSTPYPEEFWTEREA